MWKAIKEFLEYRRENKREMMVCDACEVLKVQLALERQEKKELLNRLLNPVVPEVKTVDTEDLKRIPTAAGIPWRVRSQMLTAESHKEAQLLKQHNDKISTDDLEKELDIVTQEREGKQSAV